jgi:S1-C subfamily serine protease
MTYVSLHRRQILIGRACIPTAARLKTLRGPELADSNCPAKGIKMISTILAGFLAILTIPSVCFAEERFNSSKHTLPEAIQPAWESTFWVTALPGRKGGTGSAVLIASKVMNFGRRALYMLTADHVVTAKCGPQLGVCENIVLSSSQSLDLDANETIEESPRRTVTGAEVVGRLEMEDISLIKIVVANSEVWALRPISVAEHCDLKSGQPVFLIGFPNTHTRTAADMKAIDDQNVIKRRWSKGIILDPVYSQGNWMGITADALQGSSGGPAFNSGGDLIGILHRVPGNRYVGNESDDQVRRNWQSLLVLCDSVRTFLEGILN